jgi:hypothetical protein
MLFALVLSLALQQPAASPPPAAKAEAPSATASQELWPGARYDARIPTLRQIAGHGVGEEITPPDQIITYLRALAGAAPERTRLIEYGRSWQGRPLHALVIGSAANITRLDQIKADLQKLGDPRRAAAGEAERLVKTLPAVVWLLHGVHGNEISSSDAALAQAYHLLAAQGDPTVTAILGNAIVLIDPLQNPDGRARFLAQNSLGRAAEADPEPLAAEHDEPWPGGRSNHYLFDMNRDWFAQSQPETRGRTSLFLEWFPQVVVDLHEMGAESTYYFAPPADPLNPHITKQQAGWFDTFGRANAKEFDERGYAYFTREVFDSFYPGYGESWPIFHGAIGMTYEQASARGLAWRRQDGTILTYREGVLRHFTAAIVTAHTAAVNRERLLQDFFDYRRTAIQEGERGPVREYLLPPGADPARTTRLARLLVSQGIEVRRAEEAVKIGARTLPAGTFIVPLAQPGGRLLRNLLDAHVAQPEAFVKEQDRRRQRRMPDQIYDITAWSLPLVFDVEIVTADRPVTTRSVPFVPATSTPSAPAGTPRVGYLLPWGTGTAAAVAEALQAGARIRLSGLPFTLAGREHPAGTAVLRTAENPPELLARVVPAIAAHGVELVPLDTSYTEAGSSLGSNRVVALRAPRVLLAWDTPTQSLSAGWARFVLERRYGQPVTAVRVGSLGRADLHRFDVLVLPSGDYGTAIGGDLLRRIKDWVSTGGTLITIAEASRWAARASVGLLATPTELRDGRPDVEPAADEQKSPPPQPVDFEQAIQPPRERPESIPGALLRVTLDREHWLSAGTDGEIQAIVEGSRVVRPITLDKGRNVGVYAEKDRLVAAGLVWEEAQTLIARKAFLVHQPLGRGHIVAFAEDPNFRAFTAATELLFMNAVLLGPAF